jgi:hypothetical protein
MMRIEPHHQPHCHRYYPFHRCMVCAVTPSVLGIDDGWAVCVWQSDVLSCSWCVIGSRSPSNACRSCRFVSVVSNDIACLLNVDTASATTTTTTGYHRYRIAHRAYPAIAARAGAVTLGTVLYNLTPNDLQLLHAYECVVCRCNTSPLPHVTLTDC